MASLVDTNGIVSVAAPADTGDSTILEDGYPANLEIPIRYIKGMGGDMVEARRRWVESLKWREEYKVDTILQEPNPHFDAIKHYYPHFVYNRAKNGSPVYYEIPARTDLKKLRQNGVDLDSLIRHYIYITEFIWLEIDTEPEQKLLTIMDLTGVSISQFAGEVKDFMVRAAKLIGAHYPERSYKIFVLNAPWWFNMIWKLMSPLMHANTRAKVTVCGGTFMDKLEELIDLDQIPAEIGGKCPTPILESPEEIALRNHTLKVLEANGMSMQPLV